MNPTGEVIWRRDIVWLDPGNTLQFVKEQQVWSQLPGFGSAGFGNRPVRTRMLDGVGAGGENPRLSAHEVLCHNCFSQVEA
jgi:hypothetical protein